MVLSGDCKWCVETVPLTELLRYGNEIIYIFCMERQCMFVCFVCGLDALYVSFHMCAHVMNDCDEQGGYNVTILL